MEDIGMSPDYRSGVSITNAPVRCTICNRVLDYRNDTCSECGRWVCSDCSFDHTTFIVCNECAPDADDW